MTIMVIPPREQQLRDLLVHCRQQANGLSQEAVAQRLGVSARWYGAFERGETQRHQPDFLSRVSSELKMSPPQRLTFYMLQTGHEPLRPAEGELTLAPEWQGALDASIFPGYVSGRGWDIEATNKAFRGIWGEGRQPSNVMRHILLDGEVRETVLMDWATGWALPALFELRAALLASPWHEGLRLLQREVEEAASDDAQLKELLLMYPVDMQASNHGDDTRMLRHVQFGPTKITLLISRPIDAATGHRIVWLVPTRPCAQRV